MKPTQPLDETSTQAFPPEVATNNQVPTPADPNIQTAAIANDPNQLAMPTQNQPAAQPISPQTPTEIMTPPQTIAPHAPLGATPQQTPAGQQQPQPTGQQYVPPSQMQAVGKKRGFHKPIAIILAVIGSLVLLGGGAAAYQFLVVLPNTPENTVARAFGNLFTEDATGADYYTQIDFNFGSRNQLFESLSLNLEMTADLQEGDEPALATTLAIPSIAVDFAGNYQQGNFQVDSSDLVGEMRIIGDTGYAKFDGMDSMRPALRGAYKAYTQYLQDLYSGYSYYDDFSSQYSDAEIELQIDQVMAQLKPYENQWFSFDTGGQDLGLQSDSDAADIISCFDQSTSGNFTNSLINRYIDNRFLTVQQELDSVTINGDEMRHFEVNFLSSEFANFSNLLLSDIKNDQEVYNCIDEASPEISAEIDRTISDPVQATDVSDFDFELWIDGDKKVRQIKYLLVEDDSSLGFTFGMKTRDANPVETPAGARDFSEVVQFDTTPTVALDDNTLLAIDDGSQTFENDIQAVLGDSIEIAAPENPGPNFTIGGVWGEIGPLLLP